MPKKTRPSKRYKQEVKDIIDRIDDTLPFEYVEPVQEILKGLSYFVKDSRVISVRNRRVYDLRIAKALERVARENVETSDEALAEQLGLVKK